MPSRREYQFMISHVFHTGFMTFLRRRAKLWVLTADTGLHYPLNGGYL
jgi:hypothetical protein